MRTRPPLFPRALRILALALLPLWAACADSSSDPLAGPDVQTVVVPQQSVGYETALAAKNRHTAALLSRAGLLGTGVGIDAEGGHVLTVYTLRPGMGNLPPALDGVPVVPLNTGLIMAGDVNDPTSKERPAPNGFSIGHPDITAGTIGAIVKNGAGELFILSNNHVLASSNGANIGDPSLQPGPFDGGTSADQIGTLADFVPISFNGGDNTVDAAITSVNGADVTAATPDHAYGAPGTSPVNATLNLGVKKFGRTTGLTTGVVSELDLTVDVCYAARGPFCTQIARFVDQIGISDGSFSDGGDSGSLIVTDDGSNNPVGLLFAGSSTRTIANPIDAVLASFNVQVAGESDEGDGDPGNSAPTASFTFSCTDLSCSFDGSGSSDSDGSITGYSWNFGDGTTDSGESVSHTYAAGGGYTVTLTVTDDGGATDSDSKVADVSEPGGGGITLSATGYKVRGLQKADLSWSDATGTNVDVYRNGDLIATTANDGFFTDNIDARGSGTYQYAVCEAGTSTCSNEVTVTF